jgi:UDPglucose 6-dehydrogenase
MAAEKGRHPQLLHAVMEINDDRRKMAVNHLEEILGTLVGKTIGLMGLSFKPNTDDMRDAPSIDIAKSLIANGATVRAYDPVAMQVAQPLMPEVCMCPDPYTVTQDCDALMILTDWNEFKQLDFERIRGLMNGAVIIDGRNVYDPKAMAKMGFTYRGIGRGYGAPEKNGAARVERVKIAG